jgi:hypothetical protein
MKILSPPRLNSLTTRTTSPAAAATTGVPTGIEKSVPLWLS